MEIWKTINGYSNYQVSSLGRVKSLSRVKTGRNKFKKILFKTKDKVLKNTLLNTGYLQTNIYSDLGVPKKFSVHRLVGIYFIPNPDNKTMINHKDGVRNNNSLENLEWCTLSENIKHAYDILGAVPYTRGRFGKESPKSIPVVQKSLDNNIIKKWDSGMDAVRSGFKSSSITRCCRGESKTHYGYKWEYGDRK